MDPRKDLRWQPRLSRLSFEKYSNCFEANLAATLLAIETGNSDDALLYAGKLRSLVQIVDGHIANSCANARSLWATWSMQLLKLETEACLNNNKAGKNAVAVLANAIIAATLLYSTSEE